MLKLVVLLCSMAASLAAPQGLGLTLHNLGLPQVVPQQQQQQHTLGHQVVSVQPASLIPAINPVNFVSAAALDGSSLHGFQTIDGQARQETTGADGSRRGSYSYLDANGQQVTVHYIADQHGFRSSNDPVSIALGSTAPRPSTTTTAAPIVQQNPLAHLFPSAPVALNHFGFQPVGQPVQFIQTGR